MTREGEIGMKSSAPGNSRGRGLFLPPVFETHAIHVLESLTHHLSLPAPRFLRVGGHEERLSDIWGELHGIKRKNCRQRWSVS
jgi:hypothetical protein